MTDIPIPQRQPRVPEPYRVYAIGDVHGRADLLERLFRKIDEDALAHPDREALQIFLGDYIDRGPHSRDVVDLLIDRGVTCPAMFLSGNHEACLVQALETPDGLDRWLRIGAVTTLSSYGLSVDRKKTASTEVMRQFAERLPEHHGAFFRNLAHYFEFGDYLFVHAGVRPSTPIECQSIKDLLWIRHEFRHSMADHGKFVIHGHTPVTTPEIMPNRINIDTGAYITNRLTCLVLDGADKSFLHT